MPLAIAGFPAQILPIVVSLVCVVALAGDLIVSWTTCADHRLALSLAVVSSLIFLALGYLPQVCIFQMGFRHRIQSRVSPEELREIARVSRTDMPINGQLPGPANSMWNEAEHRPRWDTLIRSTAIGKLDPSVTIFNNPDSVELSWGGALVGHWGVIIQTDSDAKRGDIAPGIRTYRSPD